MKSNSLLVLACLLTVPAFAQTLPDEINFGPYQSRFNALSSDTRAAEARLTQSKDSLAETKKFISDMLAHLGALDADIRRIQGDISSLRREIPELERYISELQADRSQTEMEIRRLQNIESNLEPRYQHEVRELRPLQIQVNRKKEVLRDLLQDLRQIERAEKEAQAKLDREKSEGQRIDRQIQQETAEKARLEQELQSADQRIAAARQEIQSIEASVPALKASLATEQGNLATVEGQIKEITAEIEAAKTSGQPPQVIMRLERRLQALQNQRSAVQAAITKIEGQIAGVGTRIETIRGQIAEIERSKATLPNKIAQSAAKIQQLNVDKNQNQVQINRAQGEVNTILRERQQKEVIANRVDSELRIEEAALIKQENKVQRLSEELVNLRKDIASLSARSREASSRIAEASEKVQSNQNAIPRLQNEIRKIEAEISKGQSELVTARNDERDLLQNIDREEAKVAELTNAREAARGEMNQRMSLYQRYEGEAQELGAGQAANGTVLGEKEGSRLSNVLSKQNGVAVGRELGVAEAKYWGNTRGEINGHAQGYAEGLASVEDRTRASNEANAKAAQDAEIFAQTNYKPVFFEEFVQEEFKKPLTQASAFKLSALTSMKGISARFSMLETASRDPRVSVEPLTNEEINQSRQVKTPLDMLIADAGKNVQIITAKAQDLGRAETAFQSPEKIPFGTAQCSQVYKGLAVFKKSCDESYKDAFETNFLNSAKEVFTSEYPGKFEDEFNNANLVQRESSYSAELASGTSVGKAEGLKVGKLEAYQTTYATTYSNTYKSEILKAKEKSKKDAAKELETFLTTKPLLTLAGTNLNAEIFRGGEEVSIQSKVKNVSKVALNGAVVIRLTETQNAEVLNGSVVLNTAAPQVITSLQDLKIRILPSAKAGEKLIVRGTIDLPGDLYRTIRQESFELVQVLGANPAHKLLTDYSKTPDIKGVFGRKEHDLVVTISPSVENIKEGYVVALTPQGEAGALTEMKTASSFSTGAMNVNASKVITFKYKLKDAAKAKNLQYALTISYGGKVIKQETIAITPK